MGGAARDGSGREHPGLIVPGLLRACADAFGADGAPVTLVNAGVNAVYRAGHVALRCCREAGVQDVPGVRHVREGELTLPLLWLEHLHAHGAPVCRPLRTPDGGAVRRVPPGWLVTATGWVDGPRLSDLPFTPARARALGRSVGQLHLASATFRPPPGQAHTFARWTDHWERASRGAAHDPVIRAAHARLGPLVHAWAVEDAVVTHGDLRPGNAIVDAGGRCVVIDFDEPVVGPAALDLARAAMEALLARRADAGALVAALLAGYREVRPLEHAWDARITALVDARAVLMAAWSLEDGRAGPGSGSGQVVSVPALSAWLGRDA